jgi:hypothetical protein
MLATIAPTATHRTHATRWAPARRPGSTLRLTAGERTFLRAVQDLPAARSNDTIMMQDGRLVALLGRPRIAIRLALAGLTRTVYPIVNNPDRPGIAYLTRAGRLALATGRRPAGPA